uniref:Glycosyltransferase n=1 Tax=Nicotiana sylvestris TaxID=4096 RepID=A0A1U7YZJ4_NICSY|nr:PREDICTED: 7-deoxyloganetic acid glucosyltransferase-like [Nicotiana sylvestris]XP_016507911.1 PREDICTED: 7-deoxyloganetic acid glucosyltransferase-like [Nicotiana tabacum]
MDHPSPHVLLFPLPIQSPINSMLQLAELFCLAGLQVTFLNTNHNQKLLLQHTNVESRFRQYPRFRFRTISDGLPVENPRSSVQFGELISSLQAVAEPFLREILLSSSDGVTEPPVTCVIPDGLFYYAVDVGNEIGVPVIPFDTISPCCLWVYLCIPKLIQAGEVPFKGNDLDVLFENVAGMQGLLRRRDFPFYRLIDYATDPYCQIALKEVESIPQSNGLILNTFEDLDGPLLSLIRSHCPQTYAIGPLHLHLKTKLAEKRMPISASSNSLWEEDHSSIQWLDAQPIESVIYVSFGSMATLSKEEILEFWHGLVNSGIRFLWVIRSNLLRGEEWNHQFAKELAEGCKERAYIVSWAPQEEVLAHSAIGGFLTHSGWNSTMESIVQGKPMICWAVYVDQRVTSRFVSEVWKIGVDMKDICDRYIIEKMVKDLMVTNRDEFKKSAEKLSNLAKESVGEGGSSYNALECLVDDIKNLGRRGKDIKSNCIG